MLLVWGSGLTAHWTLCSWRDPPCRLVVLVQAGRRGASGQPCRVPNHPELIVIRQWGLFFH